MLLLICSKMQLILKIVGLLHHCSCNVIQPMPNIKDSASNYMEAPASVVPKNGIPEMNRTEIDVEMEVKRFDNLLNKNTFVKAEINYVGDSQYGKIFTGYKMIFDIRFENYGAYVSFFREICAVGQENKENMISIIKDYELIIDSYDAFKNGFAIFTSNAEEVIGGFSSNVTTG